MENKREFEEFNRAVANGDINTLIALQRSHSKEELSAMANKQNPEGKTSVLTASICGQCRVVKFLLEACNVNVEEACEGMVDIKHRGMTALHFAARHGHLNTVELLLSQGALVNAATYMKKKTPLHYACQSDIRCANKLDVVKCLLNNGANIDDANWLGITSLMIACEAGNCVVVNHLLSANADVHKKSLTDGSTALHRCGKRICPELPERDDVFFELVQHGASINVENIYGTTAALQAAIDGRETLVTRLINAPKLLSRKQIIEIQEVYGAQRMWFSRDTTKTFSFWLSAVIERGKEPLMLKERGDPSIYQFGQGDEFRDEATLREFSQCRNTMLSQAILVLKRVLGPAHSCTTNSVLLNQPTIGRCLHVLEIQQRYLQPLDTSINSTLRISTYTVDTDERIVLVFSKAVDHLAMARKYLEDHSNSTNARYLLYQLSQLLCTTIRVGSNAMDTYPSDTQIEYVWRKLLKLDLRVAFGFSVLHLISSPITLRREWSMSIGLRSDLLAKKLLRIEANPNVRDESGNTPLHLAAMMGKCQFYDVKIQRGLLKVLIDAGARMCATNNNGETFMDLLADVERDSLWEKFNSEENMKLTFLAARVIKKNKIPFEKVLSVNYIDVVHNH